MAIVKAPFTVGQAFWQAEVYVRDRLVDDSQSDLFDNQQEAIRAGEDAAASHDPQWQRKPGNAELVTAYVQQWQVAEVDEDGEWVRLESMPQRGDSMTKPTEGKPAFPVPSAAGDNGLSERRYYIGQALAGFCANPEMTHHDHESMAKLAIQQADAVMRQLYPQSKEPQE